MDNIPPQLKANFADFADRLATMSGTDIHPSWKVKRSETSPKVIVSPMLGNVKWHQEDPYNGLCPIFNGKDTPVGCTGLAMAMILYHHKWPERSHGEFTYTWYQEGGTSEDIHVKYGDKPYDWNSMLDEYDENSTAEQCLAVAELCRDCAYASHALFGYDPTGSGGSTFHIVQSLINNFDYDTAIKYAMVSCYSHKDYCTILKSELDAGQPILYGSDRLGDSGLAHAYVCDGYDSDDMFHFNFGWAGSADGYYSVDEGGVLGSIQECYYGIKKYESDRDVLSLVGGMSDFKWVGGNQVECEIYHITGWRSHMMNQGYAVENVDTHETEYYITDTFDWKGSHEVNSGVTTSMIIDRIPSKEGDYIVYPVARFVDGEWQRYPYSDLRQSYISLRITPSRRIFSNPDIDYPLESGHVEVGGIYYILDEYARTATVTYKNRRYASYSGYVSIPETIKYDGITYTVDRIGVNAFCNSSSLISVSIPSTVKYIGNAAFKINSERPLTVQQAANSQLQYIGEGAFAGDMITSFEFPKTLVYIGKHAFSYHRMSKIVIPAAVTDLGYGAFTTFGQTQKEDIYVEWTDPEYRAVNWTAFYEANTDPRYKPVRTLFVPRGCKPMYEAIVPSDMIDKIEEYDYTDLNKIEEDSADRFITLYNTQGVCVYRGLRSARPELKGGIYIERSADKVTKISL